MKNEGLIILCHYVDDLLITISDEECISKFKSGLMKEFEMTGLGLVTYFLGIKFYKSNKGIIMHQRRYVLEILKKFKMENCNIFITPIEKRLQLSKDEYEQDVTPTQY